MKPVEIRAEAELDIIEAALWYENEREGFGAEFSLEVERAVARITENPLMFQEREVGVGGRRAVEHADEAFAYRA
jgi:plasmid stabilization system protein ParE